MAHSLVSTNFTFTDENTVGGVTFTRCINPTANFHLGGVAMGQIEFTILDYDDSMLYDRIVYPLVFNDGTTYLTLTNGNYVGIYQRSVSVEILGEEFCYTEKTDAVSPDSPVQIGYFTVDKVERVDAMKVKVTAYDRMYKLEQSADEWLAGLTFPMTTDTLVSALGTKLGLTINSPAQVTNYSYTIPKGFYATGVTYRDVLGWLCEVRCQFAYVTSTGDIQLSSYSAASPQSVFNTTNTMGTTASDFDIQPFQSVQIQASENDIGVTVGAGDPKYYITGNPLLMNASQSRIESAANKILGKVSTVAYTPMKFSIWSSGVRPTRVGRIVTVKTPHNPTTGYTVYIMSETHCNQQHSFECFGTQDTIQRRSATTQIKQLQGKTAELTYDVNGLKSTFKQFDDDLESTIEQTVDNISTLVRKGNVISSINQSAEAVSISASKLNLKGYITATDLGANGTTVIDGARIKTGTLSASKITTGTMSADRIKGGQISADLIKTGTLDVTNGVTINGISADWISRGTLSDSRIGELSATKLTSGILSTERLDKSGTANYLSGDNYLCKTKGKFMGAIAWNGNNQIYANNGQVVINGNGWPITLTGGQLFISFPTGSISSSGSWGHNGTFTVGTPDYSRNLTVRGNAYIYGSYTATGTKTAVVDTDDYGKRKLYSYETAEVYFGDIGEGEVVNGECIVMIDPIFAETVTLTIPYQVFLSPYGKGQIWVDERLGDRFIVRGDNIKFGYEIKAKRKGFEETRLEQPKESEEN